MGDHSPAILEVMRQIYDDFVTKESEHNVKGRIKLAHDARAKNDQGSADAWMDPDVTRWRLPILPPMRVTPCYINSLLVVRQGDPALFGFEGCDVFPERGSWRMTHSRTRARTNPGHRNDAISRRGNLARAQRNNCSFNRAPPFRCCRQRRHLKSRSPYASANIMCTTCGLSYSKLLRAPCSMLRVNTR